MPSESASAYVDKHTIQPILAELSEQACKDLPTELTPYLIAKLAFKFPKAGEGVPAEAMAWSKASVEIYNPKQLTMYLEDLRWAPTLAALLERVLFERPKNVPAFMIELLHKGDVAAPDTGEEAAQEEIEAAAARVQSIQRGRLARKEREEQKAAATKVQAAKRGSKARKQQAAAKQEREEQSAAATKMQARQRGRNARKGSKEIEEPAGESIADAQVEAAEAEAAEAQEEADAMAYLEEDPAAAASATKMQAMQRGRQARKEKEEQQQAATKMQARQRGKNARKK